jgi:uncharacterized membrane protein
MMYLLLLAAAGGFGYLVYTKGFDGAVAAVAALAASAAAYLSGVFENLF